MTNQHPLPPLKLEVISRKAIDEISGPPVLLVHGAWHAAWAWDEGFMDRLAARGLEVHAMSLRGHGASDGHERIRSTRIRDYVADVAQVATTMRCPPFIVGHSMGAFVVQKYLETHRAPGAILLAPVPPSGMWASLLRLFLADPATGAIANLTLRTLPIAGTPAKVKRLFFSNDASETVVTETARRMQEESHRAYLDLLGLDLCRPSRIKTPILVLGAGRDRIITRSQIDATARAYNTRAMMFDNMAHDMMLEKGWEAVAATIGDWIIAMADAAMKERASIL